MITLHGKAINVNKKLTKKKPSLKNPVQAQGYWVHYYNNPMYGGTWANQDGDINYNSVIDRIRRFEYAKADLIAIKKLYDNDSYTQVAINKYVDLIFKRGWYLDSHNPKAKEYVRKRLAIMQKATGVHFDITLKELMHSLVLYANGYAYKVTKPVAEARTYVPATGAQTDNVLVGLFTMHPASIYILRDQNNNILRFQQRDIAAARENRWGIHIIPCTPPRGGVWPDYAPDNIFHIHINREPGYVFGLPSIAAVIEDLRALRMLEEHAARLIYRELFPLRHVKVGLPEPGLGGSEEEVLAMREDMSMMPYDGCLITNERANVDIVGARGEAIDPVPTVRYFEDRAFTGLNVSPVQMGRDTSNRGTADALTTEMHDRAEAFQNRLSLFGEMLFDTYLEEGGFDVYNEKDKVYLQFPELELETIIKKNADTVNKWINNTISSDEMRKEMGYDPLKQTDYDKMFVNLVSIPQIEARTSILAARMNNKAESSNKNMSDNKNRPENQHVKRTGPKRKTEGSIVDKLYCFIEAMHVDVYNIQDIRTKVECLYTYLKSLCNNMCNENNIYEYLDIAREASHNYIIHMLHHYNNGKMKRLECDLKSYLWDFNVRVLTRIAWFSILSSEQSMLVGGNCVKYAGIMVESKDGICDAIPPHNGSCTCKLLPIKKVCGCQ